MRLHLAAAVITAATLTACSQTGQNSTPKTDEEKQMYTLGVLLSRNVQSFDFTPEEMKMVKAGLDDGAHDKPKLEPDVMEAQVQKLQDLQTKRVEAASAREKEAGTAYLAKAVLEKGSSKLPSGLIYTMIKEGTGAAPKETDTVKVNYEGKFVDGKVFDSTAKHKDKEPTVLPLNQVIPCWTQGLQQMRVGGKAKLVCPPDLAYGAEGRPPMRGNATLIFEVELLEIVKAEPAPAAAPAAAPAGKMPTDAAHKAK